ncbi:AAA+-type ATPase [Orbilia oligospora]|uniref:AAA+-type ATPase n=1 Tax=Orbilia oligospora TaxID=2813651 RepID=A0A7C8V210_ORBOL|nr:AAA+-type ATPase [Orbilia oligospora]
MSGPKTPSRNTANLNSPSKGSSPTHISQLLTIRPPISQAVSGKTVRRVTLHPSIYNLLSLSVTSPQHNNLVELKVDDSTSSVIAVAWSGSQGGDPKCIQIPTSVGDDLRDLAREAQVNLDFSEKSKSKVEVKKYLGLIGNVATVEIEDFLQQIPVGDSEGWKYYLEHYLIDVRYISEGTIFSCDYKGTSVSLRVKSVSPSERPFGGYGSPVNALEGRLGGLSIKETRVYEFDKLSTVAFKGLQDGPAPSTPRPKAVVPTTPRKSGISKEKPQEVPREVKSFPVTKSSSIGGLERQLEILRTHIASSLLHFKRFTRSNLTPPLGILLYGPPGTGKTMLLRSIATEAGANNFIIDSSLIGKFLGESEASIRKVFAEAKKSVDGKNRSIIFIDEIDAFAPKRGGTDTTSDSRLVTTLLTEMDALAAVGEDDGKKDSSRVIVIAATNRPNGIDPALRRPGRFDLEIEIPIPDAKSRLEILKLLLKDVETEFDKSVDAGHITSWANRAHGFVGADLETVVKKAATRSVHRSLKQKEQGTSLFPGFFLDDVEVSESSLSISAEDFETALKETKPSAIKDIVLELPETKWTDIGGQKDVKQKLKEAVEWPLRHPEVFQRLGGQPRKGLLLYGPPGCSKTLTAKALATEAGLNFIAVKGPELLNKYVGESERAVRELFRKARAASPSIVFFDEVDALGLNREGEGNNGGGGNSTGVLTALLNEMDGIEELGNVMILAATNKPEVIDPALLRPGRLDYILYVGPPDLESRTEILSIKFRKMKLGEDVDIQVLAGKTDGYSGADLVKICDEAVLAAMREDLGIDSVKWRHFEEALRGVKSVITMEMIRRYEGWTVGGVKKF